MSKTPFMRLWVADFLGDTLDLDATEIGAYMLLLMAQWNRDGSSLPDDEIKLARIARCGRKWPKVWGSISRFFVTDDDGLFNRRLRAEAQNVAAKREVNRHNGARGGRAKALKSNNPDLANATISPAIRSTKPEPYKKEPLNSGSKKEARPSKNRGSRLPDNWQLPKDWGEWALSQGWTDAAIRTEAEKFRDHWISVSGQRAVKRDWKATWRNWMRRCNSPKEFGDPKNGNRGKSQERVNAFISGAIGAPGVDRGPGADAA